MAIAALVLAIVSIVGSFIPFINYVTWATAIVSVVLAVKARKEAAATGQPAGTATAGLVIGIIAIVWNFIGLVCLICAGALLAGASVL